jgi:hypothetical protein
VNLESEFVNLCHPATILLKLPIHDVQVRLEVMGTKARNATYISENEAGKIAKEVVKVDKRRAVKSTHCNARSSRSHCMVGCNQFFFFLFLLVGCNH